MSADDVPDDRREKYNVEALALTSLSLHMALIKLLAMKGVITSEEVNLIATDAIGQRATDAYSVQASQIVYSVLGMHQEESRPKLVGPRVRSYDAEGER